MKMIKIMNLRREIATAFTCIIFVMCFSFTAKAENKVITIYGMESEDAEVISIPEDYPQSYQISEGTNAVYRIVKGQSVKVSASGKVTPNYTYEKKISGVWTQVSEGEPYDIYYMNMGRDEDEGNTVIEVKTDNGTYTLTIHLEDYTNVYCDNVMNRYIEENISDGMSDMELMEAIARFPASYEYSGKYMGANKMVVHGGGDCTSSTDAIILMCEKLNIPAWPRDAYLDIGASIGHVNAMAELNGVYYQLEAGYNNPKEDGYRPYDVLVRTSLFSMRGATIWQYDGRQNTGELVIPSSIDGTTVKRIYKDAFAGEQFSKIVLPDTIKEIGDSAFEGCSNLQSMIIPESVTTIGDSAFGRCSSLQSIKIPESITTIGDFTFSGCSSLQRIEIPETVTTIGDFAFGGCSSLQNIEISESVTAIGSNPFSGCDNRMDLHVAPQNENYSAQNGILYNKDKTILIGGVSKSSIVIPETVTEIAEWAFRDNDNLKQITIPQSVVSLEKHAFDGCGKLSSVEIEGNTLTSVGSACFYNCGALTKMYFPASLKSLGSMALYQCYNLKAVYFYGDAPIIGDKVLGYKTLLAFYPEGNATWTKDILESDGNDIEWRTWTTVRTMIDASAVTFDKLVNKVVVTVADSVLKENEDYIVTRDYDLEAETVTVTVFGMGEYDGTVTATFSISQDASPDIPENTETKKPEYTWSMWLEESQTVVPDNGGAEQFWSENMEDEEEDDTAIYYNKLTGMSFLITNSSKNATIISVSEQTGISSIVIPDTITINGNTYGITSIGKNAFKNNTKLREIQIGNKIKTIEAAAFSGCKKLKTVKMGKNVKTIGDKAFYNCKALTKITIPAQISKVGKQAFYKCSKLKNITIQTKKLNSKNVGKKAFYKIHSKAVIKVPKKKGKAYRTLLKKKGIGKKVKVK